MGNLDKRLEYIDIAKGIVICLMVLGHSFSETNLIIRWFYSFHMPFFFIVSGFLYSMKFKNGMVSSFKWKVKTKTLLLPYFIWSSTYQLFLAGLAILGGADIAESIKYRLQLVFQFTGGATWFLPVMFLASFLFGIIIKTRWISICGASVLMLLGMTMSKAGVYSEMLLRMFVGLGFVIIGFYGCRIFQREVQNRWFCCFVLISVALSELNITVDLADRKFGNLALYIINACMGTWTILQLCMKVEKSDLSKNKIIAAIKLWGEKSIVILCLHSFVIEIIRLLDYKVLGSVFPRLGILEGFVITAITMLIITAVMPVTLQIVGWTWGYNKV